jgi:hypothetical protein
MWYKCQNSKEQQLWSRQWVQVAHKCLPEHPVMSVHQSGLSSELGSAMNPLSTPAGPFNSETNNWMPFSVTSISYFLVDFPKYYYNDYTKQAMLTHWDRGSWSWHNPHKLTTFHEIQIRLCEHTLEIPKLMCSVGPMSLWHGTSSVLRRRWFLDMVGSCKYTE